MSRSLIFILLIFTLGTFVRANVDLYGIMANEYVSRHYCGEELANVLELVCGGVYYNNKRASDYTESNDVDTVYTNSIAGYNPKQRSRSGLAKKSEQGGIVDLCCYGTRGCSLAELRKYCARK